MTAENPSFPVAFRRPTQIMLARFVKVSAQSILEEDGLIRSTTKAFGIHEDHEE